MKTTKTALITILMLASLSIFANENSKKAEEESAKVEASATVTKSISGRVIDLNTGEPLAGVSVSIDGSTAVAFTDFDGNFVFNNVDVTSKTLSASFISYEKASVIISDSKNTVILSLKSAF